MNNPTTYGAIALLTIFTNSVGLHADPCADLLKVELETTIYGSEVKLDRSAISYYTSEEFLRDFRDRKIQGNIVIKGVPLGMIGIGQASSRMAAEDSKHEQ